MNKRKKGGREEERCFKLGKVFVVFIFAFFKNMEKLQSIK